MSSSAKSTTAAACSIIYLGMDVHKESITIAVLPEGAKSPTRLDKLPNDLPKLKKWLERVARDGEIRACYEASGAGDRFDRRRLLAAPYRRLTGGTLTSVTSARCGRK